MSQSSPSCTPGLHAYGLRTLRTWLLCARLLSATARKGKRMRTSSPLCTSIAARYQPQARGVACLYLPVLTWLCSDVACPWCWACLAPPANSFSACTAAVGTKRLLRLGRAQEPITWCDACCELTASSSHALSLLYSTASVPVCAQLNRGRRVGLSGLRAGMCMELALL